MHNWMDELLDMQEGIAALHMKLEGAEGENGDGEFDLRHKLDAREVPGEEKQAESRSKTAQGASGSKDADKQQEEVERKREDEIMDQMIQQVSLCNHSQTCSVITD